MLLIIASLVLTLVQIYLGQGEQMTLMANWIGSGFLAFGIWSILSRFHLSQEGHSQAVYISWPILATSINLTVCTMGVTSPWTELMSLGGVLIILAIGLSTWQQKRAPWPFFYTGLLTGAMALYQIRFLLFIALIFVFFYHMRSWSWRNFWSLITGTLMGLWGAYVVSFATRGETVADQMVLSALSATEIRLEIPQLDLWQWLFVGLLLVEMMFFAITGLFRNLGTSIRTHASILLLTTLSLLQVVVSIADISNFQQHVGILALYMSILLSLHNVNLRSIANEWWTVGIVVLCMALVAIPLLLPYLPWELLDRF